jgi:putative hydrolase of the HAD superfamily
MDDTLLDSVAAARQALRELLGNDAAWPVWQRITERQYARFLAGELPFDRMCAERTREFFAAFGETITLTEAAQRESARMDAMRRAWRLFDDSRPCLRHLHRHGLRTAVITNAPGCYQRDKINAMGLADSFETIVTSGEVGVAKPDPRIFHTACARLNLPPGMVAHVGDRLDIDAIAATQAGLRGIWLNRTGSRQPRPAGIAMIDSLEALPALLVHVPTDDNRQRVPSEQRPDRQLAHSLR